MSKTVTASDVTKIAVNQIGICESPSGSNKVKYNTWYYGREVSGSNYPWCMTFVQWVFNEAKFPLPLKTASCTALRDYAKSHNRWVTSGYKAGDVILYQFDSDSLADHTGICVSTSSGYVTCIEGNTSEAGSQSNGGMVCRKTRSLSLVMGAYRPEYGTAKSTSTTTKEDKPAKKTALTIDGEIGPDTVKALQKYLGTPVDGKIDGQYGQYKRYWTSIINSACSWKGGTSQAVKALQKLIGVTADGILGKSTAKALQSYLIKKGYSCGKYGADGEFGPDSAKALQRFLNGR